MAYSKSAYAKSLGISNKELENRAKAAGFDTTEAYYNANQPGGSLQQANVLNNITKEVGDFTTNYSDLIKNKWEEATGKFNVPQLQGIAERSVNQLEDIPQNIQNRAKNFGMSTNRIAQRVTNELGQFAPVAQRAISQAQTATSSALDYFNNLKAPYEWQAAQIAAKVASQLTGYNDSVRSQLDMALEKLKNGWKMDETELANVNALAQLEKQYELELKNKLAYYNATKTSGSSTDSGW